MTDCKQLLVALVQSVDYMGIFNLHSEEDCGISIEEQAREFFAMTDSYNLEPGQYLYSYGRVFHGEGWASDAWIISAYGDRIFLYKIGNDAE